MELSDFYIKGFRDLREVRLAFSDLTVLMGRNGSGKTSTLTALESLGRRVKHFGGTEDLTVWTPEAEPHWGNRDLGIYAIYEVDDDLNGPIVDINENATKVIDAATGEVIPEVPLLRSEDTLNLLAAVLAPQCFRAFMTVTDTNFQAHRDFVLSVENIEPELERAIALFHCCDVFEAFHRARTDPALAEYATEFFSDDLADSHRFEREQVERGISGRGSFELEFADAVRQAATQLVPIIRSARRFAWTGSGYAGIAIERSEIPEETGRLLTQIADTSFETFGGRQPLPPFFGCYPAGSELADPIIFSEQFGESCWSQNSAMFRGFTDRYSAPVVGIAKQWKDRSSFLLARFTPGRGGTTPFHSGKDAESVGLTGVRGAHRSPGFSKEEVEEIRQDLDDVYEEIWLNADMRELSQEKRGPESSGAYYGELRATGPPALFTVGTGTSPESVEAEIEACLPELHEHIWRRPILLSHFPLFEWPEPQAKLLKSVQIRKGALPRGSRWLWSPREGTWQVRPTLPLTVKLLEHAINDIAPAFVGFGGLVTLSLLDIDQWHQGRIIEVRYDGKPLERLPAGIARWVATSVRIGGRSLFNSRIAPNQLTTEEEAEAFLNYVTVPDDFDLDTDNDLELVDRFAAHKVSQSQFLQTDEGLAARHAHSLRLALFILTAIEDPEGWRRFSVSARPQERTLLLVDEPELHLHVDAMADIRNWLSNHLRETRVNAVVATHSPGFLDYRPDEARIAMVENLSDGHSTVEDITDNIEFWLTEHGQALGTETLAPVLLKRGFLLVEGPHDEQVINHFYGDQLARHRIGIIAMWGFINMNLTESRYLRYVGRPIAMLLDNVPEHHSSRSGLTVEEENLRRFRSEFEGASIPFKGVGHGALDIIFTLPEEAVRRHLAFLGIEGTFEGGWRNIQQEIRSNPRATNSRAKKKLAQELLGLERSNFGLGPGNFIHPVLKACTEEDRPTGTLERAMEKVFDFFANPHNRN